MSNKQQFQSEREILLESECLIFVASHTTTRRHRIEDHRGIWGKGNLSTFGLVIAKRTPVASSPDFQRFSLSGSLRKAISYRRHSDLFDPVKRRLRSESRELEVIVGTRIFPGTKLKFRDPGDLKSADLPPRDLSTFSRHGSASELSEWSKSSHGWNRKGPNSAR